MDENKKDPYNFEKIENGLRKRYKVIISERKAFKKKEKQNGRPNNI